MSNIYQNFVFCTLTADCLSTDTTLSVDDLTRIPDSLDPFDPFYLTFESTYAADEFEVVAVTVKSASTGAGTITVTRGVDGTAFAHASGTLLKGALTAGMMSVVEAEIQAGYVSNTVEGEYDPTVTYGLNALIERRGGVFVSTGNPVGPGDDPLLPDNFNIAADCFYADADTSTRFAISGGFGSQPKAAAGFQVASDTLCWGFLCEGADASPPGDGTVTMGIASALGGGTPTYVVSKSVTVSGATIGHLQVIFDRPVTLTASTQYYLVVEGTDVTVDFWQYENEAHLSLTNGVGVITDTTYDCFVDSTFSTNIGTGANRLVWLMWGAPSGSASNWKEIVKRPFLGFDAHKGALSSDRFGEVTRNFLPYPYDWHNQGGATWNEDYDHGLLVAPYVSSADNNRVAVRPLDSGWTEIVAKLEVRVTSGRIRSAGLCLRDSTSDNLLTIALSDDLAGLEVNKWNSETSFNANVYSSSGGVLEDLPTKVVQIPYYFKVTRSSGGTSYDLSVSREGLIWRVIATGFDNSWMTAAPDSVGFFAHSSGTDSTSVDAACLPIWLHVS